MDELADSASWLDDSEELRRRLAADGYLFFRGLPVPAGLALRPRAQLIAAPPGPSRLIAVHPGWKHWQPPPATVH